MRPMCCWFTCSFGDYTVIRHFLRSRFGFPIRDQWLQCHGGENEPKSFIQWVRQLEHGKRRGIHLNCAQEVAETVETMLNCLNSCFS